MRLFLTDNPLHSIVLFDVIMDHAMIKQCLLEDIHCKYFCHQFLVEQRCKVVNDKQIVLFM